MDDTVEVAKALRPDIRVVLQARVGNRALGGMVNLMYGTRYTDLCYGYNAFWTRCLPHMQVDCAGFEVETLITVRLARAPLQVREVPSVEAERRHGASNLRAFRDGCRVLYTILVERLGRCRNPHDDWRPAFLELEAKCARTPGHVARRRGLTPSPAERPPVSSRS